MIRREEKQYEPVGLAPTPIDLNKFSEAELLILRHEIDSRLPITKLSDMNLERELTLQFRVAQTLQARVVEDDDIPANQKAQVMNSVATTLQSLVKMQAEYYTPERLKKIESALVVCLNGWPVEQTEEFFKQYERMLEGVG